MQGEWERHQVIEFLNGEYNKRSNINSAYSQRAFARDLGVYSGRMNEIMHGKQGLSRKTAKEIARRLHLSSLESDYFLDLVEAAYGRSHFSRSQAIDRIKKRISLTGTKILKEKDFQPIASWFYFALIELVRINLGRISEEKMAQMLACRVVRIHAALKELQKAGLLRKERGRWIETSEHTDTVEDTPSLTVKNFHSGLLKKANEAIFGQSVESREFNAAVVSFNKDLVPVIKKRIKKFRREIEILCAKSQRKDSVYAIAIQFFNLLKETSNENH